MLLIVYLTSWVNQPAQMKRTKGKWSEDNSWLIDKLAWRHEYRGLGSRSVGNRLDFIYSLFHFLSLSLPIPPNLYFYDERLLFTLGRLGSVVEI